MANLFIGFQIVTSKVDLILGIKPFEWLMYWHRHSADGHTNRNTSVGPFRIYTTIWSEDNAQA